MGKVQYYDELIFSFRQKYNREKLENMNLKEEIILENERISLHREFLLEEKFSMLLPEMWRNMEKWETAIRYRSLNGVYEIREAKNGDAVIIFQRITEQDERKTVEVREQFDLLCCNMKELWKQNVYYDTGVVWTKELEIPWIEMKSFCLTGSVYCIIFLFKLDGEIVLGNFHCAFERYDVWKPVVIKLLETLQIEDGVVGKEK